MLDSNSTFQAHITTDLEPNKTYYVRAFVKTETFVVYGESQKFVNL